MTNNLFEKAKPILERLQSHDFQAYFVGGSVRDYIMNKSIHDIDITTSATPDEIESVFEKTIPIGREHGTINVVYQGEQYEVTTFRAEGEYIDHRRPNEVYFVRNLFEDVRRRDFTMNAIAMDMQYQIHDYFNGQQDIVDKIIRTVGNPSERFNEDALRIIRGLRFQSQLDFELDPDTFKAMEQLISDISHLSIERIVVELKKLMLGIAIKQTFNNLKQFKAFSYMPFFKYFDLSKVIIEQPMPLTVFIALLKVQQPDITSNISDLKMSNQEKKYINKIIQIIETIPKVQTKRQLKLFVYDYGKEDILEVLSYADTFKENQIVTNSPFIINSRAIIEMARVLPIHSRKEMDINGKDILTLVDKPSGPWLKSTLREIECAIITGEVNNIKPELIKWVKTHV
ncbi:CCA tRNA nucleotidyltransferase [Staphylococcus sp. KG4-3]|uniref:CCA tRNA nucleotidyltransferase n=1 Tax=Staphylococcus TaxID=1279 RepID=UPI000D1F1D97|nr:MULTISPECIES: CCA tRNA nucleotidyltransferase [Staphylococcus]MDW8542199.1 CCA tRNA nucleotidyltransferase [Staphylococcus sp. KG4-1]MDW8561555.1 CCA tRNA nucleotidyltransferase [Staphylococcus sp. KG4-3]MRF35928.1 CCA tRNA nucleotidyltransferase [Staphylococcus sp. KY49P]PTI10103.1 CCA tRNA nucleotidyltransferase [Staphylococcus xylosus]